MEGISDIKIIGIDEMRPPRIKKDPYIDLYYKLSHKAPKDWCSDFNNLVSKLQYTTNIKDDEGLFIQSWVRKPEEIPDSFDLIKKAVATCSEEYIAKIEAASAAAAGKSGSEEEATGEQAKLNQILAGLVFD